MFEELREFGLTENEITLYISLIKTGIATANRLSAITGVKRSTTYDTLNMLISKGLVSQIKKDDVLYFEAADPEKMLRVLDDKKERIQKIIPTLNGFKDSTSEKSGVSFYEGKKGVLTILNDVLDQKKELWFYGSRTMAISALSNYPENFIHKRAQQKIFLKAVLAEEDRNHPAYLARKINALSNLKFHKKLNHVSTNVFIYADRVAFMGSGDFLMGVIIKNKEIVEQQKQIFEILWNDAKR